MYYQSQNQYQSTRQNFYEIKTNCLRSGTLFEDHEFPSLPSSLFVNASNRVGSIIWKRPCEMVSRPKFFADGVSRFDVIQGELGNCWFIAAVSNLTLHQNLFEQVVPRDNTFEPGHYCGAFHFRFWTFGYWTEVVVDDRLPCNSRGQLLFMQSEDKTEFWSCLLEKAYAKFHGSYESLTGGIPSEALQDFSGGIVEIVDIRRSNSELFEIIKKAFRRQSLMTCALHNRQGSFREEKTGQGLVRGHAYSITGVQDIPVYSGVQLVQLIRIRNPWGGFEWTGSWSDRSPEWNMIDSSIKARLQVTKKNDGEFWMCVEDFQNQFHRLEICHISPDPVSDSDIKLYGEQVPWKKYVFEGAWIPGKTAGGCLNHSTFARNPQYFFNFEASDADGDADKCTVVVSLIQRTESRSFTRKEGVGKFCIGFRIFKVKHHTSPNQLMDIDFFRKETSRVIGSGPYTDSREISARFELPPGIYCIVPSTFEPDIGGNFLLRVFSEPPSLPKVAQHPYNSYQQYSAHPNQYMQYQTPQPPPIQYQTQPGPSYPGGVYGAPNPPYMGPTPGIPLQPAFPMSQGQNLNSPYPPVANNVQPPSNANYGWKI